MNKTKYEHYLRSTNHTDKSIIARINNLVKVENYFQLNIDSIINDKDKVITLLREIKRFGIDTKNQNLSNTVRKYYECITGSYIGRIF